jgi:hypothetical protein
MSKKKKNLFDSPEIKIDGMEKFILDMNEKIDENNIIIKNHLNLFTETLGCLAKDKEQINNLSKKINLLYKYSIAFFLFTVSVFVYIFIFNLF